MISEKYIEGLLNSYIKSSEGQKVVKQYRKDVFDGKIHAEDSGILSKEEMIAMGKKMVDILYSEISGAIPSFSKDAIILSEPKPSADGEYKISINIQPDALHRDSLWQDGYPNGVDDIVLLFTTGYQARGYVYGEWHGVPYRSKISRESNNFLMRAVDSFNSAATGKSKAELGDKYK